MAFLFSGEKYRHLNGDSDRSYLFARNQRPMVDRSRDVRSKRLRVLARQAVNRLDGVLHRMIEAIATAKMRRLTRELAFHNVRYHRALDKGVAHSLRTSSIKVERKD
jgi:hypothetical protein